MLCDGSKVSLVAKEAEEVLPKVRLESLRILSSSSPLVVVLETLLLLSLVVTVLALLLLLLLLLLVVTSQLPLLEHGAVVSVPMERWEADVLAEIIDADEKVPL